MTIFADIPKSIRSGIVTVDTDTGVTLGVIVLQFNPDSLDRTVQPQSAGGAADTSGTSTDGDKNEALRLKGPAEEQWKFTAEIDSTDQLDIAAPDGIGPQLAALEMLVQPTTQQLAAATTKSNNGAIEINPIEVPITLFTWGSKRVVPVRMTSLEVTEQAFDVNLNPIRASLAIEFMILTVSDLPAGHPAAAYYLAYLASKQRLASQATRGRLGSLGLSGIGPGGATASAPLGVSGTGGGTRIGGGAGVGGVSFGTGR